MSSFKVRLGGFGAPPEESISNDSGTPANATLGAENIEAEIPAVGLAAAGATITENVVDKEEIEFIKHLYDGTPFRSTYMLIDGVYLTFRELTPSQIELCRRETTLPENICHMMAAIAAYENKHTGEKYELDSIDVLGAEDGNATPLPALLAWLSGNVLKTEGLFNLALQLYAEFRCKLEKLYSKARNPDFFARSCPGAP